MNKYDISTLVFGLLTVIGWVMAKGFLLTVLAIIFPPYAWFIAVETFLNYFGVV